MKFLPYRLWWKKGLVFVGLLIGVPILLGAVWLYYVGAIRFSGARKHWQAESVAMIRAWAADPGWQEAERTALANDVPMYEGQILFSGWLTEHLMLMENGDYLIYRMQCPKQQLGEVDDFFIAYGSDGKWYYSTHSCPKQPWCMI